MVLFSFNSPVELEIALAIESPSQSQERRPRSPTAGPAHQGTWLPILALLLLPSLQLHQRKPQFSVMLHHTHPVSLWYLSLSLNEEEATLGGSNVSLSQENSQQVERGLEHLQWRNRLCEMDDVWVPLVTREHRVGIQHPCVQSVRSGSWLVMWPVLMKHLLCVRNWTGSWRIPQWMASSLSSHLWALSRHSWASFLALF